MAGQKNEIELESKNPASLHTQHTMAQALRGALLRGVWEEGVRKISVPHLS